MKFKVLLRKRGGARARAVGLFGDQTFRWFMLSLCLSLSASRHDTRWWELVELSADRSKRVGSGGHGWACRSASRPGL